MVHIYRNQPLGWFYARYSKWFPHPDSKQQILYLLDGTERQREREEEGMETKSSCRFPFPQMNNRKENRKKYRKTIRKLEKQLFNSPWELWVASVTALTGFIKNIIAEHRAKPSSHTGSKDAAYSFPLEAPKPVHCKSFIGEVQKPLRGSEKPVPWKISHSATYSMTDSTPSQV